MANIGSTNRAKLTGLFKQKNLSYPPKSVALLAIKQSSKLELWDTSTPNPTYITTYDILAKSGINGPKLLEGDYQVPEGIYKLIGLNPNSSYHLSMKVNYPNAFDKKHAKTDGRTKLGGDIFIHGKALSVGCLAMGDVVIEQLFTLVADIGHANTSIIITPSDPRKNPLPTNNAKQWVNILYQNITDEFAKFSTKAKIKAL